MLDVLIDDLTTAVPSFIGLRMTVRTNETTVTIIAMDPQLTPTTRATLQLPLHQITGAAPMATVLLLYASEPRVFTELAALTRRVLTWSGRSSSTGTSPPQRTRPPRRGSAAWMTRP
jgi:hypothetical protein